MGPFGILIFPQVEELDFAGPWELIGTWKQVAQGPKECYIVAESLAPVPCANGLIIQPHLDIASCPPLEFLLIPGGYGTRALVHNERVVHFVRSQSVNCRAIVSVCTGAFVLHAAGLLSQRKATTHWGSLDRLRALGDVEVVEERWIREGNIWTSAGVSAGMDLVLRLINEVSGESAAGKVQFEVEYYPDHALYGDCGRWKEAPQYIRRAYNERA